MNIVFKHDFQSKKYDSQIFKKNVDNKIYNHNSLMIKYEIKI